MVALLTADQFETPDSNVWLALTGSPQETPVAEVAATETRTWVFRRMFG